MRQLRRVKSIVDLVQIYFPERLRERSPHTEKWDQEIYLKELKNLNIWIPYLNHDGKKPSINGYSYAKWSNHSILMSFADATNLLKQNTRLVGLGFVIPPEFIVIDLDHCYSDNTPNTQATELVKKFNSYSEKSPSGTGIHIIVRSSTTCKKWIMKVDGQTVEFLTSGNFVTFTGNPLMDVEIRDCTELIKEFLPTPPVYHPGKNVCANAHNKPVVGGGCIKDSSSYGKAAIAGECLNIKQSWVGSRTNTILRAAFKIGQLIPGGIVSEPEAIYELEAAGSTTGLPNGKIRKTIEDGIREGKKNPRNITLS